jgi:hypothetical protein
MIPNELVLLVCFSTVDDMNHLIWSIPPLRNTINDEHLDEMVYDDEKKCELLNKYFSLVSKLEEENIPVPPLKVKLMTQLQTFLWLLVKL